MKKVRDWRIKNKSAGFLDRCSHTVCSKQIFPALWGARNNYQNTKVAMCLCEEILDRNVGKVLLSQVNLCVSLTLLQTEVGRVELSELEGLGVYIFLTRYPSLEVYASSNSCMFICDWKSVSVKPFKFFFQAVLLYWCWICYSKWLALSCLVQIGIIIQVIVVMWPELPNFVL